MKKNKIGFREMLFQKISEELNYKSGANYTFCDELDDCIRKIVYRRLGYKPAEQSDKNLLKLWNKRIMHEEIRRLLFKIGVRITERGQQVVDEKLKLKGYIDGTINENGEEKLVKIKITQKRIQDIIDHHRLEFNALLKLTGLKEAVIVVKQKESIFFLEYSYEKEYWKQIERKCRNADKYTKEENIIIPYHIPSFPADWHCRECEYQKYCLESVVKPINKEIKK